MSVLRKIAIIGVESSGKTTLAEALAKEYETVYVPEFARSYIERLNRPYNRTDIRLIAKGQIESETNYLSKARQYLFCDTDAIVCQIWSEYKYGFSDPFITECIGKVHYDGYILCDIDIPWEYDPLREHSKPEDRTKIFQLYKEKLNFYTKNYILVSGDVEVRKRSVQKWLNEL